MLASLCGSFPFRFSVAGFSIRSPSKIRDGDLRWRFGPRFICQQILLDEITAAERFRTNALEGWGIHPSRFGWLYSVSGFDAVAIKLKNGKSFCLGTDEPEHCSRTWDVAFEMTAHYRDRS